MKARNGVKEIILALCKTFISSVELMCEKSEILSFCNNFCLREIINELANNFALLAQQDSPHFISACKIY